MADENDWMNTPKQGERNSYSDQAEERKGYEKKDEGHQMKFDKNPYGEEIIQP